MSSVFGVKAGATEIVYHQEPQHTLLHATFPAAFILPAAFTLRLSSWLLRRSRRGWEEVNSNLNRQIINKNF